ncbi:gene transfer agent family protein [Agrobacterium tumefaciens]|uniref:gene transfer agent family protein n=1 Tax=Agrobacterium tumefaciens TaxID=358 RepID=UPI00157358FD|nr:gene transfer agent family protein [Agrobacterium tumefaciens]NTA79621.1 gene transfer agent family protein [Agrobacterium tumefaciens]
MMPKSLGEVTLPFGDGEYKFNLTWDLACSWERDNDRSLFATFSHMVQARAAMLTDIRSILHLGLVGGGMTPVEATNKVKTWVENRPIAESMPIVLTVVEALLFGTDKEADPTDG